MFKALKAYSVVAAMFCALALTSCASDKTTGDEAVNQAVVSARLASDMEQAVAADPVLADRAVIPAGLTVGHLIRFMRTNERAWLAIAAKNGSVSSAPTSRPNR